MKYLLLGLCLIPSVVLAQSNICSTKEKTIISQDENGRQVVTKLQETTCIDTDGRTKGLGLAANCALSAKGYGNQNPNSVSCLLPDRVWEQFDTTPQIDQFADDKYKAEDIFLLDYSNQTDTSIWTRLFNSFRKLDPSQQEAHNIAVIKAIKEAKTGQKVSWKSGDASGFAVPVAVIPSSQGFCKRIHVSVWAFDQQNVSSKTICYNNADGRWRWLRDK